MHSYKKVKEIPFFLSQNCIGMQLKQTRMKILSNQKSKMRGYSNWSNCEQ